MMMSKMRYVALVATMVGCSALQAAVPWEREFRWVDYAALYTLLTKEQEIIEQLEREKASHAIVSAREPSEYAGIRRSHAIPREVTHAHRHYQEYLAHDQEEINWKCALADYNFGCLYAQLKREKKDRLRLGEDGYAEREIAFNQAQQACDNRKRYIRLTCKQILDNIAQTR